VFLTWFGRGAGGAGGGTPRGGVEPARGVALGGYLEYSSTMSCSCTGAAISARSGLRSTFAVS
jgi:hypothetical protein